MGAVGGIRQRAQTRAALLADRRSAGTGHQARSLQNEKMNKIGHNIRCVIADIPAQTLGKMIEN